MATISSPGIGSGLDVSSIISQLMAIERKPIDKLESAEKTIQTQISEIGKIKSAVSKFRDAAAKLAGIDFWKQTTGTSSSSAVGVTTGGSAAVGSYAVNVSKLAAAQSIASASFASATTTLPAGTLTIELGTYGANDSGFTTKAGTAAVPITVEATDTLQTLRDKINAAGAGVTASILNDAGGARLVLRSSATGVDNAFRTSVAPAGSALDSLAFDPSSGVAGATVAQRSANAALTINDLPVGSASNTLVDVVDGITLTLGATTTSAVNVEVKSDAAAVKKAMEDFVAAYNELGKLIATDTKYDATAKKAGPLQGDGSVIGLQNRLRAILGQPSQASSAYARLSDAGFELQRDGTISLNAGKLDKAIANLSELRKLFANVDGGGGSAEGFARRFRDAASEIVGIDGALTARSDGLAAKLERNQDAQERLEQRLTLTQKRLEAQYSTLDAKLGTLNGLGSYVTQQVSAWNKSSG